MCIAFQESQTLQREGSTVGNLGMTEFMCFHFSKKATMSQP